MMPKTTPQRFFFAEDSDSHWYMIPESKSEKWRVMTQNDPDDDDEDFFEEFEKLFGAHRIGRHPSAFTFTDPQSNT
jgi:hypothetical protein